MPKAKTKSTKSAISTSQKRSLIKARLRRGDLTRIAALTGYDASHVSRVLRGTRNNPEIVNAAYARVGKRKENA